MTIWPKAALCVAVVILTACGTSTEGSRYVDQHGVADSGSPPKGQGNDPESPSLSSMGEDVDEKGVEPEPAPAPKGNIPSNVATTPRA